MACQLLLLQNTFGKGGFTVSCRLRLPALIRLRCRRGPLSLSASQLSEPLSTILASIPNTNMFRLQLLLECNFPLMQPAELIDLVLVLPANFHLVPACGSLVFFR